MIVSPKTSGKCRRLVETYTRLIFGQIAPVAVRFLETEEHWRRPPAGDLAGWKEAPPGTLWGRPWSSVWFVGSYEVPVELDGQPIFVRADTDGIEAMLFVNGHPRGIFTHPRDGADIGNHHTLLALKAAQAGQKLEIAVEAYAGHPCVGSQPFDTASTQMRYPARYPRTFRGVSLWQQRHDVMEFVFDLNTIVQLVESLPHDSFRRGKLLRVLEQVFATVVQDPLQVPEDVWRPALVKARQLMAASLRTPAEASSPLAGLVGHSHMDTAWMWTIEETARKCARTYSNVLNLMEQYPEFTFIQSTPFHAELMRRHYPDIFDAIKERVREGRWEPNGGMWIECDCNLTGGESMVRQFLKGIRYTREHFGYTPDTFWLPDTFGYSAAIPQIMLGAGLRYFLTTKLTWNETNTFPYDTFLWRGLDGSEVLAHFNDIQCWPDPRTLRAKLHGGGPKDFRSVQNCVQHKDVNDRRLISYGMGDGGGGPQFEMIEMARRCVDLEGCPRATHTSVSRFMHELEASCIRPPVHTGELYVEGHRGSLTSMHEIKRGNRKAEMALRDVEFLMVATGAIGDEALRSRMEHDWEILLINQFHDILPGTSIPEVHDRAVKELSDLVADATQIASLLTGAPSDDAVTVWNSLGWDRDGVLELTGLPMGRIPSGLVVQTAEDLQGRHSVLCSGLRVPALGSVTIPLIADDGQRETSPFVYDGKSLKTPDVLMQFDDAGGINSLMSVASERQICLPGASMNTFFNGEDVPVAWDNWDIDEDQKLKLSREDRLVSRTVVSDGPLEFRLRSRYHIGLYSELTQDLIVRLGSAAVYFETLIDWREKHSLLKVAFPTNLHPSFARHEIQFGHIERPVNRNNSYEKVKFEVCQHKWTDLSENRHGLAILNDGKYAVSTEGGEIMLTLMKGGLHPDPRADEGVHRINYALLLHDCGFCSESVIRPAYELNVPLISGGGPAADSLFTVSAANVVVESVKPAEDGRGYIVRLYEGERSGTVAKILFSEVPREVCRCNLLEEKCEKLKVSGSSVSISIGAFEIVTLRVLRKEDQS